METKRLKAALALILMAVFIFGAAGVANARTRSYHSHSSYSYRSHSTRTHSSRKYVNPNHGKLHRVRGYTTRRGKHVAPYLRTRANHTKTDNLRYRSSSRRHR